MESKEEALERMIDPAKIEIDRKQRKGARMCAFWMTMGFAIIVPKKCGRMIHYDCDGDEVTLSHESKYN